MPAVVCLPTYNERDNVEPMLRTLNALGMRVLVIDDSSPDGTGEAADRLAEELDGVSVLHRPRKEGLGPAYVAGFRAALATDADYVLEMDCDFSHDPDLAPRLVAACEAGADLALGSRYVAGGGTRNWGLVRRLVSRLGSLYARLVLGVGVRDLTGGFKCYRREALARLDLDAIRSRGYLFQIETTYRILQSGGRVVEVPIVFYDRVIGASKMSRGIVLEAILGVPRLRFRG
ncbi:MAG TPA: polyprenol monophosphomannose synthase [Gaiellaceae bacterium]|nr:polyprenol monophosphomannose synthase [Gaiellaceae bacterium]